MRLIQAISHNGRKFADIDSLADIGCQMFQMFKHFCDSVLLDFSI